MTAPLAIGDDDFRFALDTRVEIADTDLGGVVYYGSYARLADRAVCAYRRHLGIPELGPDGHRFVVRTMSWDYLRAARFSDELTVHVGVPRVGRSSHTVRVRIDHSASGAVVATAELTIVGVSDYDQPRPTRVPADLVERISGFEGPGLGRR
jgi:acyl-CoA thioester hydrolase